MSHMTCTESGGRRHGRAGQSQKAERVSATCPQVDRSKKLWHKKEVPRLRV